MDRAASGAGLVYCPENQGAGKRFEEREYKGHVVGLGSCPRESEGDAES